MAIKNFCDKCEKEINDKEMTSGYVYEEIASMIDKSGQMITGKQQIQQIFCESCTKKIKEFIKTMK